MCANYKYVVSFIVGCSQSKCDKLNLSTVKLDIIYVYCKTTKPYI